MRSFCFAVLVYLASLLGAYADREQDLDRLAEAVALPEVFTLLSQEGQAYGVRLAQEMFAERPTKSWVRVVERIYERDAMLEKFRALLDPMISDETLADALVFYESPLGLKVTTLEISARRAISDPDVEEASRESLEAMVDQDSPKLAAVRTYMSVYDVVDQNVASSLNENFAFLSALADAGAIPGDQSESALLADVWSDEDNIRAETDLWLQSFLAMAYGPLTEQEMQANIDFGRTEAGRKFNVALFQAFSEMYVGISRALGGAAARQILSEDI
jgi:hypothetical protein